MNHAIDIIDCQFYASIYNGKCLSKKVNGQYDVLDWQCEKGHRWEASYSRIRLGIWCPACRKRPLKEKKLKEAIEFAELKSGKCLSKEYIHTKAKLNFICTEGHRFSTSLNSLRAGSWCAACAGRIKITIESLCEVAKKQGGLFLSRKYSGLGVPHKWQCDQGHIFKMTVGNVKYGKKWCGICRVQKRIDSGEYYKYSIQDMIKLAAEKNGECLSTEYLGASNKLKWKCEKNHIFFSVAESVIQGFWCKKCSDQRKGFKRRISYKYFRDIAKSKGGKLITSKEDYDKSYSTLSFECSEGHIFSTHLAGIKMGTWCPKCGRMSTAKKLRIPYDEFVEIAKNREGKLLTDEKEFVNGQSFLKWECKMGHQWIAQGLTVRTGTWCSKCARISLTLKTRLPFTEFVAIANERNGRLISDESEYQSGGTRLKWQCEFGHQWIAKGLAVKHGTWCRICYENKIGYYEGHPGNKKSKTNN